MFSPGNKHASYWFVAVTAALLLGFPYLFSRLSWSGFQGLRLDPTVSLPAFDLHDLNGDSVRLADLRGRYLYIFFGYSKCDGVCPKALGQLYRFAETQEKAGRTSERPSPDFRIVFLSIDPARDRPEHLRAFFDSFGERFLVLGDGAEAVRDVARRFGYYYSPPNPDGNKQNYQIDHPELVYVLDPDGVPVLLYTDVLATDLAADWNRLENQSESSL